MKKQQDVRTSTIAAQERDADAHTNLAQVATVVSLKEDGRLEIEYQGRVTPARLAIPATRDRLETAALLRQAAVVVFEAGDRNRPIVIGLIETPGPVIARAATAAAADTDAPLPLVEADVDGRRVKVTAKDELVLQCGEASITLRRNGRVLIKGTYVETSSDGTNRLKGGQVLIN